MLLLEAYRNGTVFADNSGEWHAESPEIPETNMAGALVAGKETHEVSVLNEVPATLAATAGTAAPADLRQQAGLIAPKFFEGSEPAPEAAEKNIQLLEPAQYEGSRDFEDKGAGFGADSPKAFKARGMEYTALPASRPVAVNEVKETLAGNDLDANDAHIEEAMASVHQDGRGNYKIDINVPGPAVPASDANIGRNRAVPSEDERQVVSEGGERIAGPFEKATYPAEKGPVPAVRGENKAEANAAAPRTAAGSDSVAGSGRGERVQAVKSRAPVADTLIAGLDLEKTGLKTVPEEDMSGSADGPGIQVSDKEPDAEGDLAPGPSLKTGSLNTGMAPLQGNSHRHGEVAVENGPQKDIANKVPPAEPRASDDSIPQEEDAHALQAEGANEFSLDDDGEAVLKFEFSQNGGGEQPEAEPHVERPALGAVSGTAFRNLVDSASTYRPEPQAYAAQIGKQLDEVVRISVRNGGGEVRMKLNPESLGELSIRLNISNGAVTAEIIAESHEAKALLEANSSMLKDSLAQQGLVLRECVINVSSRVDGVLPERREGLFEERREEAHGSGNDGKNGRKSGYDGSSQRNSRPAYGGIDLFA
ncbi:MAG: flagellar hook-length control protein FliK [Deltaproteobacteria bacterium]|nr:flagellar hook-length control protein FliK [Deltaproteobacteria bacterium]MCL4872450.1 flagellar hook-length control protein FliK [bacterium]